MNEKKYYVIVDPNDSELGAENVAKIEQKMNAMYVGELQVRLSPSPTAAWANRAVSVFYQAPPLPKAAKSNYFAIFNQNGKTLICDAFAATTPMNAVIADDDEVVYSRYGHDMRWSRDRSIAIDGGREYTRLVGHMHHNLENKRCARLCIAHGEYYICLHVDEPDDIRLRAPGGETIKCERRRRLPT